MGHLEKLMLPPRKRDGRSEEISVRGEEAVDGKGREEDAKLGLARAAPSLRRKTRVELNSGGRRVAASRETRGCRQMCKCQH